MGFFETTLKDFIAKEITDKELTYNKELPLTRESLLNEIGKIGNSLAFDYMSELELRLNGTFSPKDMKYTLHNQQNTESSTMLEMTPQMSPAPVSNKRPPSPMYGQHRTSNNTLSTSIGPPGINVPNHAPMSSMGSAGTLTPQTSISINNNSSNDVPKERKKVKTGGAFDKAKRLLSS